MKKVYLLRHAKSSWSDFLLDDFDRPLNKRGKKQLPFMYKFIKDKNIKIDLVYSSKANRAKLTSVGVLKDFKIDFKNSLYHASILDITKLIKKANDKFESISIVGHNPGLNDFANEYADFKFNIQTCSILAIEFDVERWQDISKFYSKVIFYKNPPKKEDL